MLIVSGSITIDPEQIAEITDAAVTMMQETRKEDGCIEYQFAEVIGSPGTIRIWERWESAAHLEAHFTAPHMADWRAVMATVNVQDRTIHRYVGDEGANVEQIAL